MDNPQHPTGRSVKASPFWGNTAFHEERARFQEDLARWAVEQAVRLSQVSSGELTCSDVDALARNASRVLAARMSALEQLGTL